MAYGFLLAVVTGVLASAVFTKVLRQRPGKTLALVRELSWLYLGLTYASFRILPLILSVRLALQEPTMWLAVGVFGLLLMVESWYAVHYRYE